MNWNDVTKTLMLTGSASLTDYQTLLGEISYKDNGTDTSTGSHPLHAVTWTIMDGTATGNITSEVAIERPPVATVANVTQMRRQLRPHRCLRPLILTATRSPPIRSRIAVTAISR